MYIHGRDHHDRPIVVINAKNYLVLKMKYSLEELIRATVYISEYIIEQMLIPGQVESWNIICDLSDVSLVFLPPDLMKIFKMIQHNYRARLNKLFVIGMGFFLNAVWSLVSKLLDSNTNKKIQFIKNENYEEIFKTIHKSQVELRYEGMAENTHIIQDFPTYYAKYRI
jgi:hypothetical protein